MTKELTIKEQYSSLKKGKGIFLIKVGKRLKRSPHTIRMWLSAHPLTTEMPQDKKTLRIFQEELNKAKK